MNNKDAIKVNITASFTSNGVGDITGLVGRTQINDLVDKVYEDLYGLGYHPKGVAYTTTNPGVLVEKSLYFAYFSTSNQIFTNFLNGVTPITVAAGELALLLYDGSNWTKQVWGILPTTAYTTPLSETHIATASQQTFTLGFTPSLALLKVYVNGGRIASGYSLSGNDVIFGGEQEEGTEIIFDQF
jgi:hypothetical protein